MQLSFEEKSVGTRVHLQKLCAYLIRDEGKPRARDLIVAFRAPFFLDLALRGGSCALHIHSSLFIII